MGWASLDDVDDLTFYLSSLNLQRERYAGDKAMAVSKMNLSASSLALDVGCGVGDDVVAMASAAPNGLAVGVDPSARMLDHARKTAQSVPAAQFVRSDAVALPFRDECFDACHAERLLIHMGDMVAVVRELTRVLRRDGYLVMTETDTAARYQDEPEIELKLSKIVRQPTAGRQLLRLFKEAGLEDVDVIGSVYPRVDNAHLFFERVAREARARELITDAEFFRYLVGLRRSVRAGVVFQAIVKFTAIGRKR